MQCDALFTADPLMVDLASAPVFLDDSSHSFLKYITIGAGYAAALVILLIFISPAVSLFVVICVLAMEVAVAKPAEFSALTGRASGKTDASGYHHPTSGQMVRPPATSDTPQSPCDNLVVRETSSEPGDSQARQQQLMQQQLVPRGTLSLPPKGSDFDDPVEVVSPAAPTLPPQRIPAAPKEVEARKRAFRARDLDESELDDQLTCHAASEPATSGSSGSKAVVHLDMDAVSRIMSETRQVANLLMAAMADELEDTPEIDDQDETPLEEPESPEQAEPQQQEVSVPSSQIEAAPAGNVDGLPARFRSFLQALIAKSEWDNGEMTALARQHGVMLSGAIEVINEWSCEQYGEWLVEEGDTYCVRTDLLEGTVECPLAHANVPPF